MKKLQSEWERGGKPAMARDLAESGNLHRADRRRRAAAEREARQAEADGRRVGAASRKAAREQQVRYMEWLTVAPKREGGRSRSQARSKRFESMTGQTIARAGHRGADGRSSFHFSWRGRGLRPRKGQKNNYPYQRGEAVRLVRYIMRDPAREIEGGGVVSSISLDPDDIATAFGALEELEVAAGQANANVYVSIVVSLPHELDAAGRERVLSSFCQAFEEERLPYAGVLHRPDPGTDRRNYHAHVIASLRPFRKEADGRLSFAALPSSDLNDREWIVPLRERIARAINEEMAVLQAETGAPQRIFTHLSNRERGLAPVTKAEGKLGPGAKDRERRAADAASMRVEAVLHRERAGVLLDLSEAVKTVVERVPRDVAALLAAAAEAVASRARSLQAAVAEKRERERLRRLRHIRRVTDLRAAMMDDRPDEAGSLRDATFLSEVPLLQRAPSLASLPTLQSSGRGHGIVLGETGAAKSVPTFAATSADSPALVQRRHAAEPRPDRQQASAARSSVRENASDVPISRGPTRTVDGERERSIRRALSDLSAIPFLPLKAVAGTDGSRRFTIQPKPVATSETPNGVLHRAQALEQDHRIQALLAERYEAMLSEVLAELTSKRGSKPAGDVVALFALRPLLQASIVAARADRRLQAMIQEARDYWIVKEEQQHAIASKGLLGTGR